MSFPSNRVASVVKLIVAVTIFYTIYKDNMVNRRYMGKTGFCEGAPAREVERPETATAIFNFTRRLYTGLVSAEPLSMTSNKRPQKNGWRAGTRPTLRALFGEVTP